MQRPAAGRVREDLQAAKDAGVSTVVSLLEQDEAAELGLQDAARICAALGLDHLSHPIPDMELPDVARFRHLVQELSTRIARGDNIAVHCRASIGRSGMLCCCLMGQFGHDAPRAIAHVSAARGLPVPDTIAQTAFIHWMFASA